AGLATLAADVRRDFAPGLKLSARYCVWADDKRELARRAGALEAKMADAGVQLVTPSAFEQAWLDIEALPGSSKRHPSWQTWMTGADVLDVDVKNDTAKVHQVLPPGVVQEISYGTGSVPGSADPFITTGRSVDTVAVATDIIGLLIPAHEYERHRTAIVNACA